LLYFFRAYFRAIRAEDNHREKFVLAALLMMLSGLVLFELFSTSYYIARMWLPVGVGLAAVRIYGENNKKGKIGN
jgi:hypothetical protein